MFSFKFLLVLLCCVRIQPLLFNVDEAETYDRLDIRHITTIGNPDHWRAVHHIIAPGATSQDLYYWSEVLLKDFPLEPSVHFIRSQAAFFLYNQRIAIESCTKLSEISDNQGALKKCESMLAVIEANKKKLIDIHEEQNKSPNDLGRKWEPFKELKEFKMDSSDNNKQRMNSLQLKWKTFKETYGELPNVLESINQILYRTWGYYVGEVENLYELPPSITHSLIYYAHDFKGLLSKQQINEIEANQNIGSGINNVDDIDVIIKGQTALMRKTFDLIKNMDEPVIIDINFIKNAHISLLESYPWNVLRFGTKQQLSLIDIGNWKWLLNYPTTVDGKIHQYAPPWEVNNEMVRMVDMLNNNMNNYDAVTISAWLHYVFAATHPFEDGNGRVARYLTSVVLLRNGLIPFVVGNNMKKQYFEVLKAADKGDLQPFIDFIVQQQASVMDAVINHFQNTEKN